LNLEVLAMPNRILFITLLLIALGVTAAGAQTDGVREVTASDRSIIPLVTKLRYTTMILLPEGEEILDVDEAVEVDVGAGITGRVGGEVGEEVLDVDALLEVERQAEKLSLLEAGQDHGRLAEGLRR